MAASRIPNPLGQGSSPWGYANLVDIDANLCYNCFFRNYMIRKLSTSRGTDLNTDLCVENIGNRFDLVIVAAIRAKELARQHRNSENPGQLNAPVTALLDIQEGRVGREYLKRVR